MFNSIVKFWYHFIKTEQESLHDNMFRTWNPYIVQKSPIFPISVVTEHKRFYLLYKGFLLYEGTSVLEKKSMLFVI